MTIFEAAGQMGIALLWIIGVLLWIVGFILLIEVGRTDRLTGWQLVALSGGWIAWFWVTGTWALLLLAEVGVIL